MPVTENIRTTRILLGVLGDGFVEAAYLNEMGITTRLFPDEVTKLCNTAPERNDKADPDGLDDVDHFARFIRASKAPARDTKLANSEQSQKGTKLFDKIGCAECHVRTPQHEQAERSPEARTPFPKR